MKYVKLNVSFLNGPECELSCEYSLVFYPTSWAIITTYLSKNNCPILVKSLEGLNWVIIAQNYVIFFTQPIITRQFTQNFKSVGEYSPNS